MNTPKEFEDDLKSFLVGKRISDVKTTSKPDTCQLDFDDGSKLDIHFKDREIYSIEAKKGNEALLGGRVFEWKPQR